MEGYIPDSDIKAENSRLIDENKRLLSENVQMQASINMLHKRLKQMHDLVFPHNSSNNDTPNNKDSDSDDMNISDISSFIVDTSVTKEDMALDPVTNNNYIGGVDFSEQVPHDIFLHVLSFIFPLDTWTFTTTTDVKLHKARVSSMLVCKHWMNAITTSMHTWRPGTNVEFLEKYGKGNDAFIRFFSCKSIAIANIQYLTLRHHDTFMPIDDHIVQSFSRVCKRLVSIDLWGCTLITNSAIRHIAHRHSKSLTTVTLSLCNQLSDEGIIYLCDNCIKITTLNLADLYMLTDKAAVSIAKLPNLQYIDLSITNGMSYRVGEPQTWACISCFKYNNLLSTIHSCECGCPRYSSMTEDGPLLIASRPTLKSISLRGHIEVTSKVTKQLIHFCSQNLEKVDLSWCQLTFDDVEELVHHCKKLYWVHITRLCGHLDSTHITRLAQLMPKSTERATIDLPHFDPATLDVGDSMMILDTVEKWYPARVLARKLNHSAYDAYGIDPGPNAPAPKQAIFVHYDGWSSKWDEWLEVEGTCDRIKPIVYTWCAGNIMRGPP